MKKFSIIAVAILIIANLTAFSQAPTRLSETCQKANGEQITFSYVEQIQKSDEWPANRIPNITEALGATEWHLFINRSTNGDNIVLMRRVNESYECIEVVPSFLKTVAPEDYATIALKLIDKKVTAGQRIIANGPKEILDQMAPKYSHMRPGDEYLKYFKS